MIRNENYEMKASLMSNFIEIIQGALDSAFLTLLDYLSLHVLLCLVPAFFIAGAMSCFIPKDLIIRYIGNDADPKIAYPMATIGGFLLAVCSCTVLPLFIGIWKRGAGLGPAITFLFVAPAVNILALTYTGTLIGLDIAIARALLAIVFAILIGIIMAKIFGNVTKNNDSCQNPAEPVLSHDQVTETQPLKFDITIFSLIIILGVLSIFLAVLDTYIINIIYDSLDPGVPFLPLVFQYPPIFQTAIFLFGLIVLVILTFKIEQKEFTLFLWLIYILMTGTSQIKYFAEDLEIFSFLFPSSIMNMLAKLFITSIVLIGLIYYTWKRFDSDDINVWFQETWIFFKSIFPLIIVGVAIAGFFKFFIPPDIVVHLVGRNTLFSNFIGVLFGVFMYFPTLMEVPIAKIFLELGMARGPLFAYLLADPELSIQSILVTRRFLGDKRNTFYVGLVTIFTTLAGLLFGLYLGQGIGLWLII
jgi:uncharacterized membrane protein YraQ (UPF0718 family)